MDTSPRTGRVSLNSILFEGEIVWLPSYSIWKFDRSEWCHYHSQEILLDIVKCPLGAHACDRLRSNGPTLSYDVGDNDCDCDWWNMVCSGDDEERKKMRYSTQLRWARAEHPFNMSATDLFTLLHRDSSGIWLDLLLFSLPRTLATLLLFTKTMIAEKRLDNNQRKDGLQHNNSTWPTRQNQLSNSYVLLLMVEPIDSVLYCWCPPTTQRDPHNSH